MEAIRRCRLAADDYRIAVDPPAPRSTNQQNRLRSVAVTATDPVHETLNSVYVAESRRVLATLIRLLGDFETAEEAMHDAFRAALEQWPRDGVPANPRAWLVSAGRFKAIDSMRRRSRFDQLDEAGASEQIAVEDTTAWADED